MVYLFWAAGAGSSSAASLTPGVGLKASSRRAGDRTGGGWELSRLLCHTLFVTVYLETYGCQMNVSDTEIAWAILQKSGYARTKELAEVRQPPGSSPGAQPSLPGCASKSQLFSGAQPCGMLGVLQSEFCEVKETA